MGRLDVEFYKPLPESMHPAVVATFTEEDWFDLNLKLEHFRRRNQDTLECYSRAKTKTMREAMADLSNIEEDEMRKLRKFLESNGRLA